MSPILNKAQMTEEDIKLQFITPAITAKWSKDLITMETKITDCMAKGYIYIMTNPALKDMVKIGFAIHFPENWFSPVSAVYAKSLLLLVTLLGG